MTTTALKIQLLDRLRQIDGLELRPSPVAGGTALFHGGRDFALFTTTANSICA